MAVTARRLVDMAVAALIVGAAAVVYSASLGSITPLALAIVPIAGGFFLHMAFIGVASNFASLLFALIPIAIITAAFMLDRFIANRAMRVAVITLAFALMSTLFIYITYQLG